MRGFFNRIFFLILIGAIVYNYWQISQLKKEITALKIEVASLQALAAGKKSPSSSLNEARTHLDNAKDLALKGNYEKARTELQKGLSSLEKAGRDATAPSVNAVQSMQKKLRGTADTIDGLIKRLGIDQKSNEGETK